MCSRDRSGCIDRLEDTNDDKDIFINVGLLKQSLSLFLLARHKKYYGNYLIIYTSMNLSGRNGIRSGMLEKKGKSEAPTNAEEVGTVTASGKLLRNLRPRDLNYINNALRIIFASSFPSEK